MGLFGRDEFIDEDNVSVEKEVVKNSIANTDLFNTVTLNFIDIKGGTLNLGELKSKYDTVKYLPISAANGYLIFTTENSKSVDTKICICDTKFAHQLRPLWDGDFAFYTEDEDDEYDLGNY